MLALLLACARPEPAPQPAPLAAVQAAAFPGGLTVRAFTLDSGLQLLVMPDPGAAAVSLQTWYRVGSADEPPGKTGLAHLFEHLMFGATDAYTPQQLLGTLERLGAQEPDAWTWLDETVYVQSFPPQALPDVLSLEAARMTGLVLDQATLERERAIVLSERRYRVDNNVDALLNEHLWAQAFRDHPYGHPAAGWGADLAGLSLDDAWRFYRRWYAPDNATLVVVGDVDPAWVLALVRERYGALSPSRPERAAVEAAPPAGHREETLAITATTDRLRVGFRAPRINQPDLAALAVLDAALVGGPGGRLRRALVDTGLASDVDSALDGLRQGSLWTFAVTARGGVSAERLEAAFDRAIQDLRRDGLSPTELARGRDLALLDALTGLDAGEGRARALGWYQAVGGDWRGAQRAVDAIQSVSAQDVSLAARAWLRPEEASVVRGRSGQPVDTPPIEVHPTAGASAAAAHASAASRYRAPAGAPDMARGESLKLRAHGADIDLEYDPSSPVLRFVIGWPRGAAAESIPGQAALTARAMVRSVAARAADLGALFEVELTHDTLRMEARVLPERWPALAALLGPALAAIDPSAVNIEALKAEQIGRLTAAVDDDVSLVQLAFARAWYGPDHPYGRSALGTIAGVSRLTAADLTDYQRTQLVSEGMALGLAGAFDAGARAALEDIAAALDRAPPPALTLPEVSPPATRRVLIVDKPARSQLQVIIGHEGPSREDWPAAYLANAVFGRRGARGRLNRALRIDRGWSYFAYSQLWPRRVSPVWAARFAPGAERGVQAAALVLEMMDRAATLGAEPSELEAVRQSELDAGLYLADTAAERLGLTTWAELTGDDPLSLLGALSTVSPDQVDRALAHDLHPERALVVMVGTASILRLGAAALGPVEIIPYTDFSQ